MPACCAPPTHSRRWTGLSLRQGQLRAGLNGANIPLGLSLHAQTFTGFAGMDDIEVPHPDTDAVWTIEEGDRSSWHVVGRAKGESEALRMLRRT